LHAAGFDPKAEASLRADEDFRKGARLADRAAHSSNKAQQRDLTKEAVELLKRAALGGHVEAQYRLARILASRMLGDSDERGAFEWYLRAAQGNHVDAQVEVALAYYHGKGTPVDRPKAAYWYERAAESGNSVAANKLMLMLYFGEGIPKDQAKAYELLRGMADHGNVGAMTAVGEALEWGDGIPRDLSGAETWYRRAADKGNPRAQFRLGLILERRGQIKAAAQLYSESEKGRFGVGAYRLAVLHEKGIGIPKDLALARKYYETAYKSLPIATRHIAGQRLVQYYEEGLGGDVDSEKATQVLKWTERGSDRYEKCKTEWRDRYASVGGRCEWVYESDLR